MTAEIVIRLPDLIVEYIDNKIKLGEYLSRNDYIRHILKKCGLIFRDCRFKTILKSRIFVYLLVFIL